MKVEFWFIEYLIAKLQTSAIIYRPANFIYALQTVICAANQLLGLSAPLRIICEFNID